MKKHHKVGLTPRSRGKIVSVDAITAMARSMHSPHRTSNISGGDALMEGDFRFLSLAPGLSMHCGDVRELRDSASSSQLEPGISFNLLLAGQIHFAVGTTRYRLEAIPGVALCSAITLDQPEVLTRYTRADQGVRKVNLLMEREWIRERSCSPGDRELMARVFSRHGAVFQWPADRRMETLATRILVASGNNTLSARIALERLSLELLERGLYQLRDHSPRFADWGATADLHPGGNSEASLIARVDEHLREVKDLRDLAARLGMSVSTLQRKFSRACGLTVMDYIRRKRLEVARSALVFEGKSIGEAAFLAGYSHPSNFISAFKKRYHTTPGSFLESLD